MRTIRASTCLRIRRLSYVCGVSASETACGRLCFEIETTSCCLSNTLESVGMRPVKWCKAPSLGSKRWAESPPLAVVQPFQRVPGCAIHCWQHSFCAAGQLSAVPCTTARRAGTACVVRQCTASAVAAAKPGRLRASGVACAQSRREASRGNHRLHVQLADKRHHAAPANGSSQSYNGGFSAPNLCFGACSLGQNTDTKIFKY